MTNPHWVIELFESTALLNVPSRRRPKKRFLGAGDLDLTELVAALAPYFQKGMVVRSIEWHRKPRYGIPADPIPSKQVVPHDDNFTDEDETDPDEPDETLLGCYQP